MFKGPGQARNLSRIPIKQRKTKISFVVKQGWSELVSS